MADGRCAPPCEAGFGRRVRAGHSPRPGAPDTRISAGRAPAAFPEIRGLMYRVVAPHLIASGKRLLAGPPPRPVKHTRPLPPRRPGSRDIPGSSPQAGSAWPEAGSSGPCGRGRDQSPSAVPRQLAQEGRRAARVEVALDIDAAAAGEAGRGAGAVHILPETGLSAPPTAAPAKIDSGTGNRRKHDYQTSTRPLRVWWNSSTADSCRSAAPAVGDFPLFRADPPRLKRFGCMWNYQV